MHACLYDIDVIICNRLFLKITQPRSSGWSPNLSIYGKTGPLHHQKLKNDIEKGLLGKYTLTYTQTYIQHNLKLISQLWGINTCDT